MFETVLIANRGEIARRIIRTCRRLDIRTVAVHSEADAAALHVLEADVAVLIKSPSPVMAYRDGGAIIDAALTTGAAAVHPGYGFLSEDAQFARQVIDAGLVWVGPSPEAIASMGDKVNSRNLMQAAGIPVAAGTAAPLTDVEEAVEAAHRIGFPLMVKASAGGGGMGMGVATDEASLRDVFSSTTARATRLFGSPSMLLERYIPGARHVEVQILGLADGRVVALGERDCSVQRRHQKLVEESPSPGTTPGLRERMLDAAVRAGEAVGYRGAGTVECLVDPAVQDFVFLEMNTRLQVEHPVTEMVLGIDLVEQQLHVAAGERVTCDLAAPSVGHAIELRICAEDPVRFLPGPGLITRWEEPSGEGIRVDSGYRAGDTVTPYYDPLLAKLVIWGEDRTQALERARQALGRFVIEGPKVNVPFLQELLDNDSFVTGEYGTGLVHDMRAGLG